MGSKPFSIAAGAMALVVLPLAPVSAEPWVGPAESEPPAADSGTRVPPAFGSAETMALSVGKTTLVVGLPDGPSIEVANEAPDRCVDAPDLADVSVWVTTEVAPPVLVVLGERATIWSAPPDTETACWRARPLLAAARDHVAGVVWSPEPSSTYTWSMDAADRDEPLPEPVVWRREAADGSVYEVRSSHEGLAIASVDGATLYRLDHLVPRLATDDETRVDIFVGKAAGLADALLVTTTHSGNGGEGEARAEASVVLVLDRAGWRAAAWRGAGTSSVADPPFTSDHATETQAWLLAGGVLFHHRVSNVDGDELFAEDAADGEICERYADSVERWGGDVWRWIPDAGDAAGIESIDPELLYRPVPDEEEEPPPPGTLALRSHYDFDTSDAHEVCYPLDDAAAE